MNGALSTASRKREFQRLDKSICDSIERIESESIRLARNLREMAADRKDGKPLWSEGGFSSLKEYCEERSIERSKFYRLINTGEILSRLESEDKEVVGGTSDTLPTAAWQTRPMEPLVTTNPEAIPAVWEKAIEIAVADEEEQPEQRHVEEAMREFNARGGNLQATRRKYSQRERELKEWCEQGYAVVANINTDHALISWAEDKGKYVYVGRGSKWGNPYQIPGDGDRDRVCWCYEKHYITFKPSILDDIESLQGMVLGCYCSPQKCHADELAARANEEK